MHAMMVTVVCLTAPYWITVQIYEQNQGTVNGLCRYV